MLNESKCRSWCFEPFQRMQVMPWVNLAIGKISLKGYRVDLSWLHYWCWWILAHTNALAFLYKHVIGALNSWQSEHKITCSQNGSIFLYIGFTMFTNGFRSFALESLKKKIHTFFIKQYLYHFCRTETACISGISTWSNNTSFSAYISNDFCYHETNTLSHEPDNKTLGS